MQNMICKKENKTLFITMNSPETMNALSETVLKELDKVFEEINKDKSVNFVVITGQNKVFIAGADIKSMQNMTDSEAKDFAKLGSSVFRKIETSPKIVIAAINGFAFGGGLELAMACDIRIASDTAVMGLPEVSLGLIPGFSGTQRMPMLVGIAKAKELIYSGSPIKADEALRIGLVNKVAPNDSLLDETENMIQSMSKNSFAAQILAKQAVNSTIDIEPGIKLENKLFSECFNTTDPFDGMTAFLNKEKAVFKGEKKS